MMNNKFYRNYAMTTIAMTTAVGMSPLAISAETTKSFPDITKESVGIHYDAIIALIERGMIDGYIAGENAGQFDPWTPITRAQVAKMLSIGLDVPPHIEDVLNQFSDVSANHEYATEIATVTALGIFIGDDGQFRPWDKITREQMATVLVRAYHLADFDAEVVTINLNGVDQSHAKNVQILANLGITTELSDFRPVEPIYRASFATMIHRTLEVIENARQVVKAIDQTTVEITFKEKIEDSGALEFFIEELEIENVLVKDGNTVMITTSPQEAAKKYLVTLNDEKLGSFTGVYHSAIDDVTGNVFDVDTNKKIVALLLSDGRLERYHYANSILQLDGDAIDTSTFESYIEDGATIAATYVDGVFTFNVIDPNTVLATLTDQQKVNYEMLKASNQDTVILDQIAGDIEVHTDKMINIELADQVTLNSLIVDTPHASFVNNGTVTGTTEIRNVKANTFTNGPTGILNEVVITDSDGTRFVNDGEIRGTVEIQTSGDVILDGSVGYNVTVTKPANITTDGDATIAVSAKVDGVIVDNESHPKENTRPSRPSRPTPPPVPEKPKNTIEISSSYPISGELEISFEDEVANATVAEKEVGILTFTFEDESAREAVQTAETFTFDSEDIHYIAIFSNGEWSLKETEYPIEVPSPYQISGGIEIHYEEEGVASTATATVTDADEEELLFVFTGVKEDFDEKIESIGTFRFDYRGINYTATYNDEWILEITDQTYTIEIVSQLKISGPIEMSILNKKVPAIAISDGEKTKLIFVDEDLGENVENVENVENMIFEFSYEHVPGEVIVTQTVEREGDKWILNPNNVIPNGGACIDDLCLTVVDDDDTDWNITPSGDGDNLQFLIHNVPEGDSSVKIDFIGYATYDIEIIEANDTDKFELSDNMVLTFKDLEINKTYSVKIKAKPKDGGPSKNYTLYIDT